MKYDYIIVEMQDGQIVSDEPGSGQGTAEVISDILPAPEVDG